MIHTVTYYPDALCDRCDLAAIGQVMRVERMPENRGGLVAAEWMFACEAHMRDHGFDDAPAQLNLFAETT